MSKYEGHTPGPWRYDAIDDENQWVMDTAGNYLLQVITHDDEGRAVPADIGERNARLAADAPVLLAQRDALAEALRTALIYLPEARHAVDPQQHALIVNARAALAALEKVES